MQTEFDLLIVTHMKNCEPFVSFPRLAIDNRKALSCLRVKFSSVGGRERRSEVSVCVLRYAITEIFREEQDKKGELFQSMKPNHCLTNQSFCKSTILFVTSSPCL